MNDSFNNGYDNFPIFLLKTITNYPQCKPLQYELWRLFTNMLLHFDIIHIVSNTILILINGYIVESISGHRETFLYIISGTFGGSLALAYINRYKYSLGASHTGMGLNGAVLGLCLLNYDSLETMSFIIHFFIGISCIIIDVIGYISYYDDDIGYIAHWMGYLNGLLLSLYFSKTMIEKKWKTYIKITCLNLFILLNGYLFFDYMFYTYKTNVMNDVFQPIEYHNCCLEYITSGQHSNFTCNYE
jgi:membrane associated rhomboid family serine protease